MTNAEALKPFLPAPPDEAGVVSWIHIGDLHMVEAGKENHDHLLAFVKQINEMFAHSISFVYLPGDNADDGSVRAYTAVREALDGLDVPWTAIIGDHDVHEKSYANFLRFLGREKTYAFSVGKIRFVALNAFDLPRPDSFTLLPEQLAWCEGQLEDAQKAGQEKVLFLHCYPSDLKQGKEELERLVEQYRVKLIDMGHTHYNEISNDGTTVYTATRSTGQIEEGAAGFSVTNFDGAALSWRFFEKETASALMIVSPADERLLNDSEMGPKDRVTIRAKMWTKEEISRVTASFHGSEVSLSRVSGSEVWEASQAIAEVTPGIYPLTVTATTQGGASFADSIRVLIGERKEPVDRQDVDQENAIGEWTEHGILGTQLGPNKNGKKW